MEKYLRLVYKEKKFIYLIIWKFKVQNWVSTASEALIANDIQIAGNVWERKRRYLTIES
jgi:hypothetical protein